MNKNILKDKKKPKLKKIEKIFYLVVVGGTIFLIVNGFKDYKEIMNNPIIVRGVIYDKVLYSNGIGNYRWEIYFKYEVNNEFYKSKLIDHSPYSKEFSIGDSLYVYLDNYNNEKALAFKNPINLQIHPNLLNFMLRDSLYGYLLILVILFVLIYTLPVLFHYIYLVLAGLLLKIIDKKRAGLFFEKELNKVKEKTIVKIDDFFDRW